MKQLTLEDLLLYEADLNESCASQGRTASTGFACTEQALTDTSDEAIARLSAVFEDAFIHRLAHIYAVGYDDTEYIVEALDGYDPVILAVIPKI